MAVPRYNKAAHEGRGTRAPEDTWPRVKGPLDLILFEGWMLGFQPVCPFACILCQLSGWPRVQSAHSLCLRALHGRGCRVGSVLSIQAKQTWCWDQMRCCRGWTCG